MKIVIDIDENVFTRLFDNGIQDNEIAVDDVCEMARALRLGTPLEVQPCEDCVSREVVIEHICEAKECYKEECKGRTLKRCPDLQWVFDLSSVTPQQTEWIPVTKRLPKYGELVLFSTKTGEVFEGRYFDDDTNRQWYSFRDDTFAWDNVVTAWMPLPEPYKESEKESEE